MWDRRAAISGTLDIDVVLYKYFVTYNKFHLSFYFFSYFFIIVLSFNYLLLLCIGLYSPFQLCKIKILYCKWIERGYKYIFYVKSSNCTILNVSAVIYVIMFMYNLEINYLSIYLSIYAVTRGQNLIESVPFMQPGWRAERTPGGFIMIPPWVRKTDGGQKMATDPGGGVRLPGQWYCSTPGSRGMGNARCCSPTDED